MGTAEDLVYKVSTVSNALHTATMGHTTTTAVKLTNFSAVCAPLDGTIKVGCTMRQGIQAHDLHTVRPQHEDLIPQKGALCYYSNRGQEVMLDYAVNEEFETPVGKAYCVALIDGFDKLSAARTAKQVLIENIKECIAELDTHDPEEICKLITKAYKATDAYIIKKEAKTPYHDGASCASAFFINNHCIVSFLGNCEAFGISDGTPDIGMATLSERHLVPENKEEIARIKELGGFISNDMVMGHWHLTRSFGARFLKKYVIAEPQHEILILDDKEVIVVGVILTTGGCRRGDRGQTGALEAKIARAWKNNEGDPLYASREIANRGFMKVPNTDQSCVFIKIEKDPQQIMENQNLKPVMKIPELNQLDLKINNVDKLRPPHPYVYDRS